MLLGRVSIGQGAHEILFMDAYDDTFGPAPSDSALDLTAIAEMDAVPMAIKTTNTKQHAQDGVGQGAPRSNIVVSDRRMGMLSLFTISGLLAAHQV